MEKNVARKQLEVKTAGQALECGTLDVLMSLLQPHTLVFLSPLVLSLPYRAESRQDYLVHVTARPYPSSPILYATFHAAQVVGTITLIYPHRFQGKEAETRAQQLQQDMMHCLQQLLKAHPSVSNVMSPARYRIPDEWIWSVRSREPRIVCRNERWVTGWEVSRD